MGDGGLTRTMVIWVPDWPVTAAAVATGRSPDEPIAVLEKGKVPPPPPRGPRVSAAVNGPGTRSRGARSSSCSSTTR